MKGARAAEYAGIFFYKTPTLFLQAGQAGTLQRNEAVNLKCSETKHGRRGAGVLYLGLLAAAVYALSYLAASAAVRESAWQEAGREYRALQSIQDEDGGAQSLGEAIPDYVGWLTLSGTAVDYPVVQGTDNAYYLTHTARKEESRYGAIFLDCRSSSDFSDLHSVIYGHNMKNGAMFEDLLLYRSENFFNGHSEGSLILPQGETRRLFIFSCTLTDGGSPYYQTDLSDGDFPGFLDYVQQTSLFFRDPPPETTGILTLSTCSYEFENARTVVLAALLPVS